MLRLGGPVLIVFISLTAVAWGLVTGQLSLEAGGGISGAVVGVQGLATWIAARRG